MLLNYASREYYFLEIPTDPPLSSAELSLDYGTTWVAGEAANGGFRWLIQGPDADDEELTALVIDVPTVVPYVRYGSPPQRRVEEAPAITLTS